MGNWFEAASEFVWDKPYAEVCARGRSGRPEWFPGGEINYARSIFDKDSASKKDREALVFYRSPGRRKAYTYASLFDRVRATASFLESCGVRKGDRVLALCRSKENQALLILAFLYSGIQFGIIYHRFPAGVIDFLIRKSGAAALICDEGAPKLRASGLRRIEFEPDALSAGKGFPPQAVPAGFLTSVTFSSGSIGAEPKIFLSFSAGGWIELMQAFQQTNGREGNASFLSMLDFAFGAWPLSQGLMCPLMKGGKVAYLDFDYRINEPRALEILRDEGIEAVISSPAFFYVPTAGCAKNRRVNTVTSGGDKIRPAALKAMLSLFPRAAVINCVGQQEIGLLMTTPPLGRAQLRDPERIGILKPMSGLEYRISGQVLLIKNTWPSLASKALTCASGFRARWRGAYFSTGDMVRRRRLGLQIIGRKDRLVKFKGRQLNLGYAEDVLGDLPFINKVKCLIGESSQRPRLLVFATLKGGFPDAARALIHRRLIRKVGTYAKPDEILFLRAFPASASGKVMEKALLHEAGL